MRYTNYSKGYSLIELVVYITLFATISLVVMQSLIFALKTYANARAYRALQQNAELSMERITREIRQADTIVTAGSTFGSSPGVLAISGKDNASNPYTANVSVDNESLKFVVSGTSSFLTNSDVSVSGLVFFNASTTTTEAVKMEMTLITTRAPFVSKTFYTTVILRE